MVGTLLSFCAMAVGARELSGHLSVFEMLFFRSAVGLVCIGALLVPARQRLHIRAQRIGLHGLRNAFHFAGQYGWFLGIGLLPLAEVFALEFTVPIWTLLVAAVALKETITRRKLAAVVLGLTGVIVIARPGYAILDPASFIVIGAAICYAVAHTCTKSLSHSEPAISILFWMCVIQLPIALLLSLPGWQWPRDGEWPWLTVIGLTALTAHYCMTKAMRHAELGTVVTLDFFRLPLIAVVGVLLYEEPFEMALLLGGLLMLCGNLVSLGAIPHPGVSPGRGGTSPD